MMTKEEKATEKNSLINNALGVFITFFGVVTLIATVYTKTFIGEITNLVVGIILLGIGAGMIIRAKMQLKKIKLIKNKE